MIDTGASASTINTKYFARIIQKGNSWKRIDTTVTLANGNTVTAKQSILISLPIEFEEFGTFKHEFLVLDLPGQDLILGCDFITKHKAWINAAEGRFELIRKCTTAFKDEPQEPKIEKSLHHKKDLERIVSIGSKKTHICQPVNETKDMTIPSNHRFIIERTFATSNNEFGEKLKDRTIELDQESKKETAWLDDI